MDKSGRRITEALLARLKSVEGHQYGLWVGHPLGKETIRDDSTNKH
jgi:hypothetical protein